MKRLIAVIIAASLSVLAIQPANAVTFKEEQTVGAERGDYAGKKFDTPNKNTKVKADELSNLTDSDNVIVASSDEVRLEAANYSSFKSYMNDDQSVYIMSKKDALALQKRFKGVKIETLTPISIGATTQSSPTWGLDRIDSPNTLNASYVYDTDGTGVKVYVVDTGVATLPNDLSGRVAAGYSYFNDGYGSQDCNGHGTHVAGTVAGTVYGVAKKATIVPVKVLDCTGYGSSLSFIAGLNWILSTHTGGPAVINMSLGGSYDAAMNSAVQNLIDAGFTVVAAAGNETVNACTTSPASASNAITVAAVDSTNRFASFSNYGSCVDIIAPGVSIRSLYFSSATGTAIASGTSMAAPHVAGVAARILQSQPNLTPAQVAAQIDSFSAKDVVTSVATGTVNKLLSLQPNVVLTPDFSISSTITSWKVGVSATGSTTVTPNGLFTNSSVLTVSGLPAGVAGTISGKTVTFTGSPTTAGSYLIAYTLTEGSNVVTKTQSITVAPADVVIPSVILSPSTATIYANSSSSFSTTATLNSAFTAAAVVTVSGVPTGLTATVSGRTISFSGSVATAGSYTVTITATEGGVSASANLTLSVSGAVATPDTPTVRITVGTTTRTISARMTVQTGVKRPTSYVVEVLRNGTVISTQSLRVSTTAKTVSYTTPRYARNSGTYVLKIVAKNAAGASAPFTSNSIKF